MNDFSSNLLREIAEISTFNGVVCEYVSVTRKILQKSSVYGKNNTYFLQIYLDKKHHNFGGFPEINEIEILLSFIKQVVEKDIPIAFGHDSTGFILHKDRPLEQRMSGISYSTDTGLYSAFCGCSTPDQAKRTVRELNLLMKKIGRSLN